MSIEWILSSGVLILLILSVRFLFRKKLPPCLRYALWLVAALRLLYPVSISETDISILNLLPEKDMTGEGQENGQAVYRETGNSENMLAGSTNPAMASQAEPGDPDTISQPEAKSFDMTLMSESEAFDTVSRSKQTESKELNIIGTFRFIWLLGLVCVAAYFWL